MEEEEEKGTRRGRSAGGRRKKLKSEEDAKKERRKRRQGRPVCVVEVCGKVVAEEVCGIVHGGGGVWCGVHGK